jgi:hypothetical protein
MSITRCDSCLACLKAAILSLPLLVLASLACDMASLSSFSASSVLFFSLHTRATTTKMIFQRCELERAMSAEDRNASNFKIFDFGRTLWPGAWPLLAPARSGFVAWDSR